MYIVRVIPIGRGIFMDSLEYFTREKVPVGSIVEVPVRNKNMFALVISRTSVKNEKALIKSHPYAIRRAGGLRGRPFFGEDFMNMAEELAQKNIASVGQVLAHFAPKPILESLERWPEIVGKDKKQKGNKHTTWEGPLVIQAPDDDRLAFYKTITREEFARGKSVFLCMPTVVDIERALGSFERGISEYAISLHGNLKKRDIVLRWNEALAEHHPILIIATGSFISIPRRDVGTFIIDRENSNQYKRETRPYIDIRQAIRILAEMKRAELIQGDSMLRTETIYEKESGHCHPRSSVKYRILSTAVNIVANMARPEEKKAPFTTVSEELRALVKKNTEQHEHLFIFVHRRGLATSTVCNDCGHILKCPACNAPLILYKGRAFGAAAASSISGKNTYVCNKCSFVRDSKTLCDNCKSWRLAPLGIGIERVEGELRGLFPQIKIFKIEKEPAQKFSRERKIIDEFLQTPGSILLGTEMALLYLREKVENVAVASFDSIFAIPDYRVGERAFNILLRLRTVATQNFLLQTRNPELELFGHALRGNSLEFFRDEIVTRKKFNYPPFAVLVKITREGQSADIKKDLQTLAERLKEYKPFIYPAFISRMRGKERMHMLIKIGIDTWPDGALGKILRDLPPEYFIDVNPKEIT